MKRFYVYEWRDVDTGEVFYVGKGCGNRYKSLNHRNKYFLDYYNNHNTESVIVNYFDNEENAFAYELELTNYYKGIGQCQCCLMDGGYGGYSKIWSKEMKKYWSEYNPMKDEKQRERMSVDNPMKDSNIASIVGEKHKRAVVINGIKYNSVYEAAKANNVYDATIIRWCNRGYNTNGNPCRYENEKQKSFTIQKTSSKKILVDKELLFNSLREAANFFGVKDTSPLCRALKTNKPYHNHIVEYANQQPS